MGMPVASRIAQPVAKQHGFDTLNDMLHALSGARDKIMQDPDHEEDHPVAHRLTKLLHIGALITGEPHPLEFGRVAALDKIAEGFLDLKGKRRQEALQEAEGILVNAPKGHPEEAPELYVEIMQAVINDGAFAKSKDGETGIPKWVDFFADRLFPHRKHPPSERKDGAAQQAMKEINVVG